MAQAHQRHYDFIVLGMRAAMEVTQGGIQLGRPQEEGVWGFENCGQLRTGGVGESVLRGRPQGCPKGKIFSH